MREVLTERYRTEKTEAAWAEEQLERAARYIGEAGAGKRHRSLFSAAASVGPYVAAGLISEAMASGRLIEAAARVGLDGKRAKEARRAVQDGLVRGAGQTPWYPPSVHASPGGRVVRYGEKAWKVPAALRPVQVVTGWAKTLPGIEAEVLGLWTVFYPGTRMVQGEGSLLPIEEVRAALEDPFAWPAKGKEALPLWQFVRMEDNNRGTRRQGIDQDGKPITRDPVVEAVDAVVLDYDDEVAFSLDWVHERFGGVSYLAHTTSSHLVAKGETPARPRGRVILPLARPVSEVEYMALCDYLAAWPGLGRVGLTELRSVRRVYYVPARGPGGYEHRVHLVEKCLDPDAMLGAVAEVDTAPAEEDSRIWDRLDQVASAGGMKARASIKNLERILREDPQWMGRVRENEFSGLIEWDGRVLRDNDLTQLAADMDEAYGFQPSADLAHRTVALVASKDTHHPVRAWLRSLRWDGIHRLDDWLPQVTGSQGMLDGCYGRKLLLSMVARVMRPGCKVDTVLILVGDQGAGKSQLVGTLGGLWFKDSGLSIGDKDGYIAVRGAWLYELGELDSISRRDLSQVKAFISSQTDDYRPPYGRNNVQQPRQVVFVGTTNEGAFLSDSTGSRRFWPVRVGRKVDLDLLGTMRDQLFAEAVVAFDQGEPWWLSTEEDALREELSGEYQSEDPWTDLVGAYLEGRRAVDVLDVALNIGKRVEDVTAADEKRLVRILQGFGWRKAGRVRVNGVRKHRWEPHPGA